MSKSWNTTTTATPRRDATLSLETLRIEVTAGPDVGAQAVSADETLSVGTAPNNTLRLTDPTVSRYHLELRRDGGLVRVIDLGSTNGTSVAGVLVDHGRVPLEATLALGTTRLQIHSGDRNSVLVDDDGAIDGLIGASMPMRRLATLIRKTARASVPVLITGESGTGKELVARAIHELSERREAPFVVVDCGAMSDTLIANELFGHEPGAFTGADDRYPGAFERAANGTIFLDEIGELPAASQAMLLGVLERGRFRRVGGRAELETGARIVCATNRDLRGDVNRGTFRLDLYYRLGVIVLQTPPLRERSSDVPALVTHLAASYGHRGPIDELLAAPPLQRAAAQGWPGNVRELRNLVAAVISLGSDAGVLLPSLTDGPSPSAETIEPYALARGAALAAFEQAYLSRLYAIADKNVSKAARLAQMDRSHLLDLLRRAGIR